jgi:hypothetical protein
VALVISFNKCNQFFYNVTFSLNFYYIFSWTKLYQTSENSVFILCSNYCLLYELQWLKFALIKQVLYIEQTEPRNAFADIKCICLSWLKELSNCFSYSKFLDPTPIGFLPLSLYSLFFSLIWFSLSSFLK